MTTSKSKNYRDKSGITQCRVCGILKFRARAERRQTDGKYAYRGVDGKAWNKRCCPECIRADAVRLGLVSDRKDLKDHKNRLGFESEQKVKSFFEDKGFAVIQTSAHGADLVITRDGITITCEVKSVTKAPNAESYFCSAVYPLRRRDDFIALVLGDLIWIEPMSAHLSKCNKAGTRTLTKLIKSSHPVNEPDSPTAA